MITTPKHRVYAALATAFNENNIVDVGAMSRHAMWLLDEGCDGLVVFGSTGEAVSLTMTERKNTLKALIDAGVPAGLLIAGTGCCAVADTAELSSHAHALGCYGVLIMPPFLFKGLTDEGIQETFRQIITNSSVDLRVYLYHFPLLSGVKFTSSLVNKLMAEFPDNIKGYKDSGGNFDNTRDIIENCPGLEVYSGSELPLSKLLQLGGAGCISATANTQPRIIKSVIEAWQAQDRPAQEAAQNLASANRLVMQDYTPMAAAVKTTIAAISGNSLWQNIRPPLVGLSQADEQSLLNRLSLGG